MDLGTASQVGFFGDGGRGRAEVSRIVGCEVNRVLFDPGSIVATPGCLEAFRQSGEEPLTYLTRHLAGDWGEVDAHDRQENELSLQNSWRLLSAYTLSNGTKIWIITEADRSATTFLLPEEY
jgi:hypothetical protein